MKTLQLTLKSENTDYIVLFTGSKSDDMCLSTSEVRNSLVLDSGCISTVAGTQCIVFLIVCHQMNFLL